MSIKWLFFIISRYELNRRRKHEGLKILETIGANFMSVGFSSVEKININK